MNKVKLLTLIGIIFSVCTLSASAQNCVGLEQYYLVNLDLIYHSSNNARILDRAVLKPTIVGDSTNIGFKKWQRFEEMAFRPNFQTIKRFSATNNCSQLTFKYPVYTTIMVSDANFKDLGSFRDYVDYDCNLNLFIGGNVSGSCSFNGDLKYEQFLSGNEGFVIAGSPVTESGTYTITTDFNATGSFSGRTVKPKRVPNEIKKQLEKG